MSKFNKIKLKINNIVNNIKDNPELVNKLIEVIEKGKSVYNTIKDLPKEKKDG